MYIYTYTYISICIYIYIYIYAYKCIYIYTGLVVRGLKKKFVISEKSAMGVSKKKVVQAVDGLDLTVADKTIFCLLGHNGAGVYILWMYECIGRYLGMYSV